MRKAIIFILVLGVVLMTGCSNGVKVPEKNPQVTVEMEDGGIFVIELNPAKAPNTVNNFLSLAGSGFYNGVIFHRVIKDLIIQGGDPDGTGYGGPGYTIKGEMPNNGYENNDLKHVRGAISMARSPNSYDSAGSQFFILGSDYSSWDGDYTVFGMVIEGMDVVDTIMNTRTRDDDSPRKEQKIKSMTVETFGEKYPEPKVIK